MLAGESPPALLNPMGRLGKSGLNVSQNKHGYSHSQARHTHNLLSLFATVSYIVNMLRCGLLLLGACLITSAVSAQDLDWVKPFYADSFCRLSVVEKLPGSGIVALGLGEGEIHTLTTGSYRGSPNYYSYIVRYDATGKELWNLIPQPDKHVWIYDLKTDGSGHIYIAGEFVGMMVLGEDTFTAPDTAAFVARLDGTGKTEWIRRADNLWFSSIRVPETGDIFLDCYSWKKDKDAQIEDGGGSTSFALEYTRNYGFAKFSPAGQLQWAKFFGGNDTIRLNLTDWETDGNSIYILATPYGKLDLETGPGKTIVDGGEFNIDEFICLARYSADGDFIQSTILQREETSYYGRMVSTCFDLDKNGDIILAGSFFGRVDMDMSDKEYYINANGQVFDQNYFLARYTGDMELKWAYVLDGDGVKTNSIGFHELDVKADRESIFLYGIYLNNMDLDPGSDIYPRSASQDHFFAEYSKDGKFLSGRILGSEPDDDYQSLLWDFEIDENKNIYTCGIIFREKQFDFDPGTDTVLLLNPLNNTMGYLAKYAYCKKPVEIIPGYDESPCGRRMSYLFARNDHYPVKWYDSDGNMLHEGATLTLSDDSENKRFIAEDGCGYKDSFTVKHQEQTPSVQRIFPNPVKDKLTIEIEGIREDIVQAELINSIGQSVYSRQYTIHEGFQNLFFSTGYLRPGIYHLVLWNNCFRRDERILVIEN
jgi:hypothetical protein